MRAFTPSELILNPDGSVYHLHLLPQHIAPLVITVGDPARVDQVSRSFDRIDHKIHKREFITHTGFIGKKNISVISTGIGTDNIDIVFNELFILMNYDFEQKEFRTEFRPVTVIRIGTSGCLQPDIPVDSFLVSKYAIGLDNLMHFYRYEETEEEKKLLSEFTAHAILPPSVQPYASSGSGVLVQQFNEDFYKGITLTCPGFYGPQGRETGAAVHHAGMLDSCRGIQFQGLPITNLEMETAGIYALGKLFGFTCISLNALLANRATGKFSADPAGTVDRLIKKTMETLSSDNFF